MNKGFVSTDKAPAAIGVYSQGTTFGDLVFTSGQLPINPATGKMAEGIAEATRQTIENVQSILLAAGSSLENVLKATVYLADMADFAEMNRIYMEFFGTSPPARTCFQVAKLPMDAIIEIEVIAHR